jgi:hypothetical protein
MSDQLKCPKCGQIDMVQKVSALYGSGISVGEYGGPSIGVATPVGSGRPSLVTGSTRLSGVSQTALSAKLAPPAKPTYKTPGGWLLTGFIVLLVVGIIGSSISVMVAGTAEDRLEAIIVEPVALGIVIVLLWWRNREGSKRRRKFEQEMAMWKEAIGKWNQLYYCARDDGVFIPGQNRFVSVDQMTALLYGE